MQGHALLFPIAILPFDLLFSIEITSPKLYHLRENTGQNSFIGVGQPHKGGYFKEKRLQGCRRRFLKDQCNGSSCVLRHVVQNDQLRTSTYPSVASIKLDEVGN